MDYKEKYEQAIERLKQWDREHPSGFVLSDRDKFIFPELKESEAEKIRKALLEMVHDTTGDELWACYNVHKEEALAWLEKQGDKDKLIKELGEYKAKYIQKDLENHINSMSNKDDEKIREALINTVKYYHPNESPYMLGISNESVVAWLKKQGQVKESAISQHEIETCKENDDLKTSEDEKIRKELIGILSTYRYFYSKEIAWLKSLQGRVQPQHKQEWSEEDEQHIDSLLKRLDALCRNKFERTRFAISEDRDWLKSLRHQSRWKPSELQLGCLSDAIEYYNSSGYPAPKLKELLDDLKKLKEE